MVQINFAQKTINVKIVYYGPGMSGKTTNLEVVHQRAPDVNRGDLTSISTDGDRTLFFDYMPLDLGTVAGMRTCFQLYTVPGQVYYNSTRKLVLQGVDGVIFIADSAASMVEQNLESLRNLEENLNEYGKSLASMPHVIQYNKRDLPDAMDLEQLEKLMNPHGAPSFEAVANTGQGVFPTLKALAASVLKSIMQEAGGAKRGTGAAPAAPQVQAPAPEAAIPAGPAKKELDIAVGTQGGGPFGAPSTPQGFPQQTAAAARAPQVSTLDTRPRPAAAQGTGPSGLMQSAPSAAPAVPRTPARTTPSPTHNQPKAAARTKAAPAREPVSAPRPKGGGLFTGAFVVVAAAAGAVIAWVVLKAL